MSVTPQSAYAALARQHPELMVECEICNGGDGTLTVFLDDGGFTNVACPAKCDAGKRPRDLGELLALVVTTGKDPALYREVDGTWNAYRVGNVIEDMRDVQWQMSTPEEAAARLYLAVRATAEAR